LFEELTSIENGRPSSFLWRELAERSVEQGDSGRAVEAYRRALSAAGVRDRSRAVRAISAELRRTRTLSSNRG
jgi:hypothetical protein